MLTDNQKNEGEKGRHSECALHMFLPVHKKSLSKTKDFVKENNPQILWGGEAGGHIWLGQGQVSVACKDENPDGYGWKVTFNPKQAQD